MISDRSIVRIFDFASLTRFFLTLLLLALVMLGDAYLIARLAGRFGVYFTIAIAGATGLVAIPFVLSSARGGLLRLETRLREGSYPRREFGDLLSIVIAGILMVVPGFVTDILGLTLFLQPTRRLVGLLLSTALDRRLRFAYEYLKMRHFDVAPVTDGAAGEQAEEERTRGSKGVGKSSRASRE
ncbi:MAG: FxsA family protein [Spirochaetota bacterium]